MNVLPETSRSPLAGVSGAGKNRSFATGGRPWQSVPPGLFGGSLMVLMTQTARTTEIPRDGTKTFSKHRDQDPGFSARTREHETWRTQINVRQGASASLWQPGRNPGTARRIGSRFYRCGKRSWSRSTDFSPDGCTLPCGHQCHGAKRDLETPSARKNHAEAGFAKTGVLMETLQAPRPTVPTVRSATLTSSARRITLRLASQRFACPSPRSARRPFHSPRCLGLLPVPNEVVHTCCCLRRPQGSCRNTTWVRGWSVLVSARSKEAIAIVETECDSALTIESDFSKEPERNLKKTSPD